MTKKKEHNNVWSDWFYYDESSPTFLRWKVDLYSMYGVLTRTRAGMVAGSIDVKGYYRVQLGGRGFKVHRVIYEMFNPDKEFEQIDHKDGNRINNQISNLEGVSASVNMQNRCMTSTNTSGVTGVTFLETKQSSGNVTENWRAFWTEFDGKRRSKNFSVGLYGYDKAFELAVEYRKQMIKKSNEGGMCYSERHGDAE